MDSLQEPSFCIDFPESSLNINITDSDYDEARNKEILDLSNHKIYSVPTSLLIKFPNVQYLYLEGNNLTELSKDFFPTLGQLKWLDVRNNQLTTVPNTIMGHESLQVLLLQSNNIERLPVEIGSLSSLRGLQLADNPTVYPPAAIVRLGVKAIIDFLQKQWQQLKYPKHIQLVSESISSKNKLCKTRLQNSGTRHSAGQLDINSHEQHKLHRRASEQSPTNLSQCINVQPFSKHLSTKHSSARHIHLQDFNQTDHERKISFSSQHIKALPSQQKSIKKINDRVQPKLLRDLWIEKIRQTLITQEAILQQMRSADALKKWQDEARLLQTTQIKKDSPAGIHFPYDTDPDYLRMLTRSDIMSSGSTRKNSSALNNKQEESINGKIISMLAALQELQGKESSVIISPRSEQKALAQEIKKIKEIQRCLNALKLKNFGQLSVLPAMQN